MKVVSVLRMWKSENGWMKKSVLEKEMPESESKKKLCVFDESESKDVWLVRKWK